MSIGDALAQARRQAGLTVAQVGHQTGIRETIITAIEADDYSACGGDSYARGYIRSIAQAVGADPEPLIRVYNTARARSQPTADDTAQSGPQPTTDDTADPVTVTGAADWIWRVWLAVVVVAMGGLWFAAFQYLPGPRHVVTLAPSAREHPVAHRLPHHSQAPPAPQTPARPPVPPVTPLAPVSAAAFGPGGTAQGDNPQNARLALAGNPAAPWHTSWYNTAHFGNLQTGTGLLLDLGRPVTVTNAQITLGSIPGADIELRAGDVPALADLQTVARMTNAGGVVQLRPTGSVRGRYLLIWFTLLPPDPAGTFQASVYSIRLEGRIWLTPTGGAQGHQVANLP
jgi:transcriptional regulator with XRE-family HTH domain